MRESQTCTECQDTRYLKNKNINFLPTHSIENVAEEDIDISRGQATVLKIISHLISKDEKLSKITLKNALEQNPDTVYFIKENWGDEDHFINLALNEKKSNQISQTLYFLNLKNKLNRVPTKEDMKELSKIEISEYEEKFTAWENFLDVLGFDPWYKNNNIVVTKNIKDNNPGKNKIENNTQEESNLFLKEDTISVTVKKINELRIEIVKKYEQKDLEENYVNYSYVEMFSLLEKYMGIIYNKSKYNNIKDLL